MKPIPPNGDRLWSATDNVLLLLLLLVVPADVLGPLLLIQLRLFILAEAWRILEGLLVDFGH